MQKRAELTHPLVGTVLDGKYAVSAIIGRGGTAIVFAGENINLRRPVAIKLIADPERTDAFERLQWEARVIASLQHPNVCDIYDSGWVDGIGPYLVVERLVGDTIADRLLATRSFGVQDTLEIITQILSALQATHARGVVHRDLKPQNLFIVERLGCAPLVKILDFGLAKDLTALTRLTRPGRIVGTPEYMAPEQLTARTVTPAADLFAVGVLTYEMMTGRHPFAAENRVMVQSRILRDPPDPMNARPEAPRIPRTVEDVVFRALEKEPDRRFPDAYAMQRELRRAALPAVGDDAAPLSSDTGSTGS